MVKFKHGMSMDRCDGTLFSPWPGWRNALGAAEDIATLKQMEKRSENMASLIEVFQDIDETHHNEAAQAEFGPA